jgi:hypothetical protein
MFVVGRDLLCNPKQKMTMHLYCSSTWIFNWARVIFLNKTRKKFHVIQYLEILFHQKCLQDPCEIVHKRN